MSAWHRVRQRISPLRRALDIRGARAWRKVARTLTPISGEQVLDVLKRAVGEPRELLIVHSSLSACGHFRAGPEGVLTVLREFAGTLCLPTHSYCYPRITGEPGPLFDPELTPSQNGLLTELFRKQTGVRRSIHATHALAASGPLADDICAGHYEADSPCGVGTPYSRLVSKGASALMFGVSFHAYTFFHTVECEAGPERAYEPGVTDWLRVVDERGKERDCKSRRQSWAPARFKEAGDLLETAGLVRRVPLGRGALLFVADVRRVHEFLAPRLRRAPDLLRQSCSMPLR